jgi:hypothetical protein
MSPLTALATRDLRPCPSAHRQNARRSQCLSRCRSAHAVRDERLKSAPVERRELRDCRQWSWARLDESSPPLTFAHRRWTAGGPACLEKSNTWMLDYSFWRSARVLLHDGRARISIERGSSRSLSLSRRGTLRC